MAKRTICVFELRDSNRKLTYVDVGFRLSLQVQNLSAMGGYYFENNKCLHLRKR